MADGGEELLVGTILGQLAQLVNVSYPIKILGARPLYDEQGNYRRTIEVEMASGTYYISVTDVDPEFDCVIREEP